MDSSNGHRNGSLKLNPSKYEMMCITSKKKPIATTYHINNSAVECGMDGHLQISWGEDPEQA